MNKNSFNPDELETLMGELSVEALVMGHNRVGALWYESTFTPDYSKFYFILDGEGTITVGDQTFFPKKGELWLMPAGVPQSFSVTDPENTYLKYWVHFRARVGEINLFDLIKTPLCLQVHHDRYLKNLFDQMISYYSEGNGITKQTMINTYMTQIVCYYLELAVASGIEPVLLSENTVIPKVLSYIKQHLSDDLTLKDLAAAAHLQENYFVRYFKKFTNTSPMQYVNNERIKKAAYLLTTTDEKISKIAAMSGFSDEVYFSRVFKKNYGVTPSNYRNRW